MELWLNGPPRSGRLEGGTGSPATTRTWATATTQRGGSAVTWCHVSSNCQLGIEQIDEGCDHNAVVVGRHSRVCGHQEQRGDHARVVLAVGAALAALHCIDNSLGRGK